MCRFRSNNFSYLAGVQAAISVVPLATQSAIYILFAVASTSSCFSFFVLEVQFSRYGLCLAPVPLRAALAQQLLGSFRQASWVWGPSVHQGDPRESAERHADSPIGLTSVFWRLACSPLPHSAFRQREPRAGGCALLCNILGVY